MSHHLDIPHSTSRPADPRIPSSNPFFQPYMEYSSSVPSHSSMQSHFMQEDQAEDERPIKVMDGLNHRRSNSVGYNSAKIVSAGPPVGKTKHYSDPFYGNEIPSTKPQGSNRSLGSLKEEQCAPSLTRKSSWSSSRKSSVCSVDSDSSPGSRSDANSVDRKRGVRSQAGSNEMLTRGYSSGEYHAPSRTTKTGLRSKFSRFSSGDVRNTSDSSPQLRDLRIKPGGTSGRVSSSSGDNSRSKSPKRAKGYHSGSSDSAGRPKVHSPATFCKDDDPTFIHNSINLYLDMEVFDSSKGESFRMAFRCPVVKYGEVGELPVLVIVSNISAYIFKIIAPER